MWNLKKPNSLSQRVKNWLSGVGQGDVRKWRDVGKGYILSAKNSRHPMYNTVIMINNNVLYQFSSVQSQSCPTLCNPMDCSTPGPPVHHQLPEFTQTHVH